MREGGGEETSAMMSVRGLSLETATRRMDLRIEWAVVVLVMREFMEERVEMRWVTRAGEGFIASEEGGEVSSEHIAREWIAVLVLP